MSTIIKPFTPAEVVNAIDKSLIKKAPDYDLIAARILKQLSCNGIMKLTHLFNASIRLQYVPMQWKIAEVIMIPKQGKPLEDRSSY